MNRVKGRGPQYDPCGTPELTMINFEVDLLFFTYWCLSLNNLSIQLTNTSSISIPVFLSEYKLGHYIPVQIFREVNVRNYFLLKL